MDRRRFLAEAVRAGSLLLILPAGELAGCVSGSKDGLTGPIVDPANGLRFTSDIAGIHTHDFTIAMDDLATPTAAGVKGPTTVSLSHRHVVMLSQGELARIQAGETLNKATSIVDGHLHNFKFSLATVQPPLDGSATPGSASS
jgi:hypothetical protein